MARALKTVIILFWLVMLGLLLERTYFRSAAVVAFDVITAEGIRTGAEWFGVYQKGRKIGHARTTSMMDADTYHFNEESDMDVLALGRVQRVRTWINAYTTHTFVLKYFDFKLSTDASTMEIKGAVVKNSLVIDIMTAGETRKERFPLREPVYLTPNIRPAVVRLGLEPGRQYRFPLFSPATMSTQDAFVTVEARETIKVGDADLTVYKLRETFQDLESYAWITPEGETLKEESPLGYALLKETPAEAVKRDKAGPAVDLVELVRIPSQPVPNAGSTAFLRASLGGVPLDRFELDGGRQSWKDGVIEVRTGAGGGSYALPYRGRDRAEELRPTALVQSDDRNIREQAAKILGRETDARAAVLLLNEWVYGTINKQPVVSIPSAVEVLRQKIGDCNEHTVLFTALARASGIPARMAAGVVYLKNGFYYHAWPEVWLDEWVAVDPTFNQLPADATHIRFVTGELSRQVEIMRLVGKLKIDVIEYR